MNKRCRRGWSIPIDASPFRFSSLVFACLRASLWLARHNRRGEGGGEPLFPLTKEEEEEEEEEALFFF